MQQIIDMWDMLAGVSLAGNTGRQIVGSLLIFMVLVVVQWLAFAAFARVRTTLAEEMRSDSDDTLVALARSVRTPFFVFLALYVATRFLTLPEIARTSLDVLFLIAFSVQGILIAERIVMFMVARFWLHGKERVDDVMGPLRLVLRLVLGLLAVLLVLSNLGINVTSLIAGLGIGGIAIGFALQEVLSDMFNSFSIYVDKPFRPGDFIIVRNYMGTVKRITFNSTRIQSLGGEEVIVPNKDIANEWVQNFKSLRTRRVPFSFGVVYGTPRERLKEIPGIVETIVRSIEKTRFDRAHFKSIGPSSLDFEVVYYVESEDYMTYMNIHQEVNLRILEEFAKRGIEIAYPTQTVYVAQTPPARKTTRKR